MGVKRLIYWILLRLTSGEASIEHTSARCSITVLIRPRLSSLLRHLRAFLSTRAPYRHLIHSGAVHGGFTPQPSSSAWLLQDGSLSFDALAALFKTPQTIESIDSVVIDVSVICDRAEWTAAAFSGLFAAPGKIRVNPVMKECESVGGVGVRHFIDALLSPLVSFQSASSLMAAGSFRVAASERPTLRVFAAGQGGSALFCVDGFSVLVDGGYARSSASWALARHIAHLDVVLLSHFGVNNVFGTRALLERIALGKATAANSENVLPEIGVVYCNGVVSKSSRETKETEGFGGLVMSGVENVDAIVESISKLSETRRLPCVRDERGQRGVATIKPVCLYSKIATGALNMYVLTPTLGGTSPTVVDTQKFVNKTDLPGYGGAREMSVATVVVWKSAKLDASPLRILFADDVSQRKLFDGLDKLKAESLFDSWKGLPAGKCGTMAASDAARAAAGDWKLPGVPPSGRSFNSAASGKTTKTLVKSSHGSGKPKEMKPGDVNHQLNADTRQTSKVANHRRSLGSVEVIKQQMASNPESNKRQSMSVNPFKAATEVKRAKKTEKLETAGVSKDSRKVDEAHQNMPNLKRKDAAASGGAQERLGSKSKIQDAKKVPAKEDGKTMLKDSRRSVAPSGDDEAKKGPETDRGKARRSLAPIAEGTKKPKTAESKNAKKPPGGKLIARSTSGSDKGANQSDGKNVGSTTLSKPIEVEAKETSTATSDKTILNATMDVIKPPSATSTAKKSDGECANGEKNAEAINLTEAVLSLNTNVLTNSRQNWNVGGGEGFPEEIGAQDGGMDVNVILPKGYKPRDSYFPEIIPPDIESLPSNADTIEYNSGEVREDEWQNKSDKFATGSGKTQTNNELIADHDEKRSMNELEERSGHDGECSNELECSGVDKSGLNCEHSGRESTIEEECDQNVLDSRANGDLTINSQIHGNRAVNNAKRSANDKETTANDPEPEANNEPVENHQQRDLNDQLLFANDECRAYSHLLHLRNGVYPENGIDSANPMMEPFMLRKTKEEKLLKFSAASPISSTPEAVPSILDQSFPDQSILEQSNSEPSSPLKSNSKRSSSVVSNVDQTPSMKLDRDAFQVKSILEQSFPEESLVEDGIERGTPSESSFDPAIQWDGPQSLPFPPSPTLGDESEKIETSPPAESTKSLAASNEGEIVTREATGGDSSLVIANELLGAAMPSGDKSPEGIIDHKGLTDDKSTAIEKPASGNPAAGKPAGGTKPTVSTGNPGRIREPVVVAGKPISARPVEFAKRSSTRGSGNASGRGGIADRLNSTSIEPAPKRTTVVKRSRQSLMPGELSTVRSSLSSMSLLHQASVEGGSATATGLKPSVIRRQGSALGLSMAKPFYVDVAFIPNHGDFAGEFFARVRARYYVLNAANPDAKVIAQLINAKSAWGNDGAAREVTLIPTHDSEELIGWMLANRVLLERSKVEVTQSASRSRVKVGGEGGDAACCCYQLEL